MRVVCVDGNENDLANTVALCREHPAIDEVVGYTSAAEALVRHTMDRVELVLLATDLPDEKTIPCSLSYFYRRTRTSPTKPTLYIRKIIC